MKGREKSLCTKKKHKIHYMNTKNKKYVCWGNERARFSKSDLWPVYEILRVTKNDTTVLTIKYSLQLLPTRGIYFYTATDLAAPLSTRAHTCIA